MKILIADDDFTSCTMLKEMLANFGTVHVADSGRRALAYVKKTLADISYYDLICLDMYMPGLSGERTLMEIRKLEKDFGRNGFNAAKIVVMTTVNDSETIRSAFRGNCDAYWVKPFDRKIMMEYLNRFNLV